MGKNFKLLGKDIFVSYTVDTLPPDKLDVSHTHSTYEILFVPEGHGQCLIEGSSFPIKPGTLFIMRPFEYHSVEMDKSQPYERYVAHFSSSALVSEAGALLGEIMGETNTSGKYYNAQDLSQGVYSLFERLGTVSSLPEGERDLYLKMLLSELVVLLSASGGERLKHDEVSLGARVIRYLNENITSELSLDILAKRFFVSKYYLCRAFKKHNGISVHGYINQKRVMHAKQLIESGETASVAAYRVGFGDYSAFYRAYVKLVGRSPSAEK